MKILKSSCGFSLIEILLVISILAILSTSSFAWFSNYQRQTEIKSVSNIIVSSLRDAQSRSISGKDFMRWGIFFDDANNKLILFRDNSGIMEANEESFLSTYITLKSDINPGCDKIIFEKINGSTIKNCTIRIFDKSNDSNFVDITVTNSGLISS